MSQRSTDSANRHPTAQRSILQPRLLQAVKGRYLVVQTRCILPNPANMIRQKSVRLCGQRKHILTSPPKRLPRYLLDGATRRCVGFSRGRSLRLRFDVKPEVESISCMLQKSLYMLGTCCTFWRGSGLEISIESIKLSI